MRRFIHSNKTCIFFKHWATHGLGSTMFHVFRAHFSPHAVHNWVSTEEYLMDRSAVWAQWVNLFLSHMTLEIGILSSTDYASANVVSASVHWIKILTRLPNLSIVGMGQKPVWPILNKVGPFSECKFKWFKYKITYFRRKELVQVLEFRRGHGLMGPCPIPESSCIYTHRHIYTLWGWSLCIIIGKI